MSSMRVAEYPLARMTCRAASRILLFDSCRISVGATVSRPIDMKHTYWLVCFSRLFLALLKIRSALGQFMRGMVSRLRGQHDTSSFLDQTYTQEPDRQSAVGGEWSGRSASWWTMRRWKLRTPPATWARGSR